MLKHPLTECLFCITIYNTSNTIISLTSFVRLQPAHKY